MQYAAYAATSSVMQHMQAYPLANFLRQILLITFEQIWLNLGDIWANLGEILADLIRFGQNQNIESPKKFDFLQLCQSVFYFSSV